MTMTAHDDLQYKINKTTETKLENLKKHCSELVLQKNMLQYRLNVYMKFFESSPECIAVIRLNDGYLIDANEEFEVFSGYTKDEFRHIAQNDFLLGNRERIRELAITALEGNGRFQTDCDIKHKDGKILSSHISARLAEIDVDEGVYIQVSIRNAC